ncbi:MAG: hypothetical protein CBC12_07385 [Candidatus Puniceispirillum sp. TMED52]|nr:MAG: hypothetical protein CBC12_07385 [Candidatus Puniceispirillum sp. TMED52]
MSMTDYFASRARAAPPPQAVLEVRAAPPPQAVLEVRAAPPPQAVLPQAVLEGLLKWKLKDPPPDNFFQSCLELEPVLKWGQQKEPSAHFTKELCKKRKYESIAKKILESGPLSKEMKRVLTPTSLEELFLFDHYSHIILYDQKTPDPVKLKKEFLQEETDTWGKRWNSNKVLLIPTTLGQNVVKQIKEKQEQLPEFPFVFDGSTAFTLEGFHEHDKLFRDFVEARG